MALWVVFVLAAMALFLWRWSAGRGQRGEEDTPHEREQRMNLEIRRSRHVEQLQQEYARKAEEFKALQEAKAKESAVSERTHSERTHRPPPQQQQGYCSQGPPHAAPRQRGARSSL